MSAIMIREDGRRRGTLRAAGYAAADHKYR
jgi:hypothetical protein